MLGHMNLNKEPVLVVTGILQPQKRLVCVENIQNTGFSYGVSHKPRIGCGPEEAVVALLLGGVAKVCLVG